MLCPDCNGKLTETRKRTIISFFVACLRRHTYRCFSCKRKVDKLQFESTGALLADALRRS